MRVVSGLNKPNPSQVVVGETLNHLLTPTPNLSGGRHRGIRSGGPGSALSGEPGSDPRPLNHRSEFEQIVFFMYLCGRAKCHFTPRVILLCSLEIGKSCRGCPQIIDFELSSNRKICTRLAG